MITPLRTICILFLVTASAACSFAQEARGVETEATTIPDDFFSPKSNKNSSSVQVSASDFFGAFGKTIQSQAIDMATTLLEKQLDFLANPQTAKKLAAFQKNYYDSLIEEGFSQDQAFELLINIGNPITGYSKSSK